MAALTIVDFQLHDKKYGTSAQMTPYEGSVETHLSLNMTRLSDLYQVVFLQTNAL